MGGNITQAYPNVMVAAGSVVHQKPIEFYGVHPDAPAGKNQAAIQQALDDGGPVTLWTPGIYAVSSDTFTVNPALSTISIGPGVVFTIAGTPTPIYSLGKALTPSTRMDVQASAGRLQPGLSSPVLVPEIIFDQSSNGTFLFTQFDGTYGQYLSQLSIAGGTATAMTGKTALTATNASSLKTSAGTALVAADIFCAWWISTTRFLFAVRGLNGANQNCCFLFLANYNGSAWTVGAEAGTFANGNAVLNMGTTAGVSVANNIILHARSLAIGGGKIVCGDYNVASGRVNGSTKDAVRVYQSTDNGATWSTLLTFNTDGSTNQIRHLHSVKYDRYRGHWYFLFGDAPKNSVVRWDGTSAAPPANTPLNNFGNYPGWEVLYGLWQYEVGDLAINPAGVYYIPDDTGVADHTELQSVLLSTSFPLSHMLGPVFEWSKINPARAPLICCDTPGGGSIWGSLFDMSKDATRGFDFWSTGNGVTFEKIAVATDYGAATAGTIANLLMLAEGRVCISGTAARGVRLWNPAVSNNYGSIIANVGQWDGTVRQLN